MIKIVDMREATGCDRAFAVWDLEIDGFVISYGKCVWDGEGAFREWVDAEQEVWCEARILWIRSISSAFDNVTDVSPSLAQSGSKPQTLDMINGPVQPGGPRSAYLIQPKLSSLE